MLEIMSCLLFSKLSICASRFIRPPYGQKLAMINSKRDMREHLKSQQPTNDPTGAKCSRTGYSALQICNYSFFADLGPGKLSNGRIY